MYVQVWKRVPRRKTREGHHMLQEAASWDRKEVNMGLVRAGSQSLPFADWGTPASLCKGSLSWVLWEV